jgi:hypothetical protein
MLGEEGESALRSFPTDLLPPIPAYRPVSLTQNEYPKVGMERWPRGSCGSLWAAEILPLVRPHYAGNRLPA